MLHFDKNTAQEVLKDHVRLPPWINKKHIRLSDLHRIKSELRQSGLHTVCEEARCPNRAQCFKQGTATFLILGSICTRACNFCSITHGKPTPLNPLEPQEIAKQISKMNLKFAVITSVSRDDLKDGGANQFVQTIKTIRKLKPNIGIEVLTPDFMGNLDAITKVVSAHPTIFNHNVETVPSLYLKVRPSGNFTRSLFVLAEAKKLGITLFGSKFRIKSGFMLGLGETKQELLETCSRLAEIGVDIITLGQYLRPTRNQLPVVRYIHPQEFIELGGQIRQLGISTVYAGPTVRSSFNAIEISSIRGVKIDQ